ncbi:MAG: EAL domain-containing protein [Gammaproteobacteria bacterium]|nr:EAL domain-containing protein [Gammaproteobacteria bacterium]
MASDPVDQAMVKSIIQVAHAVGKKTIAEYVQDAETLAMLCQLGVDYAQGFHIGEPADIPRGEPFTLPRTGPAQVEWLDFQNEFILLCVQWYLRYGPSYQQLEDMMLERGVPVRHTTIRNWVQRYNAEADNRVNPRADYGSPDYKVEEAYIYVKGHRKYLYRAIGLDGNTLDFKLCDVPEFWTASDFFRRHLQAGDVTGTVANDAR